MSRVHLVSQDFEGGNILYLSLMGTPWISRHSCCRLYLMNYSSLQKCHYKSYSQATLNAVLGTHVRSYCWKTHVVSCSASVKKVGEHHIRPGENLPPHAPMLAATCWLGESHQPLEQRDSVNHLCVRSVSALYV